jgi:pyrroline-5-carboxylate reductase
VRARAAQQFGIRTGAAVDATLADYDAIVLAVKPQVLKEVAQALAPHLKSQLVISIAAGIRGADLARWLGGCTRVVRTMPNTPALVGMGVTGLAALPGVDATGRELASSVLGAVGEIVWFDDEAQLDAVTAISGSGRPASSFIEALQEAARRLGLNDEQGARSRSRRLAGAAQLAAQSGEPASALRERVTSKAARRPPRSRRSTRSR